MFKKTIGTMILVAGTVLVTGAAMASPTMCSMDTEKDGKTACAATEACLLVKGECIPKKSLPAGESCKKSGVCVNTCVKEDGTETNSDGSETGKCN
jgi:hypothetical protein